MASFHIQINTGGKGKAAEHGLYIGREGRFTEEKYGGVEARGVGNLPQWAHGDTQAFWTASDEFERSNGNTYREYELALPRELSESERVALVERFVSQELGTARPYQWAIHHCTASDGKDQPHVHVMFSDRQQDGIERGAEQFFKRYNAKHPERGGCRKATYGDNKVEAAVVYEQIRERWATVQNQALEMAGVEARVDHRSLAAQGIRDREPGRHRGPAVSGIEARGEVSRVGERQREQRAELTLERAAVVTEMRVVTREEMALERMAVRERRELAAEVTGPERELVLPLVEADRREQIGRAQAAAERRVERRQGLGIGGQLKGKLVAQARALRERIGQQLGRVKEWVAERFPEPLKQIHQRTRELFGKGLEPTPADLAALSGRAPSQGGPAPGKARRPDPGRPSGPRPEAKTPDEPPQVPAKMTRTLGPAPDSLSVKPAREPAAKPLRSEAEQERERMTSMSSRELWKLYYARNPSSVAGLVERDSGVVGARQMVENQQRTAAQALQMASRAEHDSHRWREAHQMQAKLHDLGLKPSAYLVEQEAARGEAKQLRAAALEAVTPAMARYALVRSEAEQRITQETAPARAHAAEIKQLASEAGEREERVKEFEKLANYRARGRKGYEDHSPDWQATPTPLRQMIEVYNRAPPEAKEEIRQQLSMMPERAKLLEKHLKQRRELGLEGPDHSYSL